MNRPQAEHADRSIQAVRPLQMGAQSLIYPTLSGPEALGQATVLNKHATTGWGVRCSRDD